MSTVKRACVLIAVIAAIRASVVAQPAQPAQSLNARSEGDRLRVVVDRVRFLTGDALRKLHDGVPVVYIFRLSAQTSRFGSTMTRSEFRFVISYDIFEERFQVSRVRPTGRVVSHLTAAAAEATFVESLELPTQSLGSGTFWLRLEYQTEEPTGSDSPTVSLGGLVEIFSRTTTKEPTRGVLESGPFRLSDLPRSSPSRGATTP